MKVKKLNRVKHLITLFLLVLCVGCGQKNGDTVPESPEPEPEEIINITYAGQTQPAEITVENAPSLAMKAVETGNYLPGGFQNLFYDYQALYGQTDEYDTTPEDPTMISFSQEYYGSCGGSVLREFEISTISKNSEGSFEYNNLCSSNGSLIYDGRISYKQVYSLRTETVMEVDLTFNNLTMQSSTQSLTVAGSVTLKFNGAQDLISVFKELTILDKADDKTYWLNNVFIEYTYNENNTISQTWSGRYYDYDYGYIDFLTKKEVVKKPDYQPHEGILQCVGQNNGLVELIYQPLFLVTIECDVEGDHEIDWSTQLQQFDVNNPDVTRPVANAGEDRDVWMGTTVFLDGSLSTGRGGNSHYFNWTFESCPQNNCPPMYLNEYTMKYPSFIPEIPGDYIIKLYVYDSKYSSLADTVKVTVRPMEKPGFMDTEWKFSQYGASISQAGISLFDIDGDDQLEIITDGHVAVSGNSSAKAGNFLYIVKKTSDNVYSQIATSKNFSQQIKCLTTADVDNDNLGEIYIGLDDGNIYVYDGLTLEQKMSLMVHGSIEEILIADTDGDGLSDIVVCEKNALHIFDAETMALKWETDAWGGLSVAVGNVDTDAAPEIITSYGFIIDGVTHQLEWEIDDCYGRKVKTGDVDDDGIDEIFISTYSAITLFEADTKEIGWEFYAGSDLSDFLIADSDGDDIPEIIVSEGHQDEIHGYDIASKIEKWSIDCGRIQNNHIAVGDIDSDGILEVAVGTYNGSLLVANPISEEIEWRNLEMRAPFNSVDAGDVDGDGIQEIVLTSFETEHSDYTDDGTISIFKADTHETVWQSSDLGDISANGTYALRIQDMDNDHVDDIVAAVNCFSYESVVQVYDGSTHTLKTQSLFEDRTINGAFEFYDLYQDDTLALISGQIFEGSNNGSLISVIDGNTLIESWYSSPLSSQSDRIYDIDLANVDSDDNVEILASVKGKEFWIFDGITHEIQFVSSSTGSYAIEVCDIDQDGSEEILVGKQDGVIDIYSTTTFDLERTEIIPNLHGEIFTLKSDDIDQNGSNELIVACDGALYVIDPMNHALIWSQSRLGHNLGLNNQIVVKDIDQDGKTEILIGSDLAVYQFEYRNE